MTTNNSIVVKARFAPKLKFLFKPAPYKFARGGRGSGKSWGFARALLILGTQQAHRILCTREVQKSIRQSVHRLLKDQIAALGLEKFYTVFDTEIRGINGTLILFAGLSDQTADSIKSFEGCTICWCEEAQSITKQSWTILLPTIFRTERSEVWATYNPQLETDETHKMAVINPAPGTVCVEMNYIDNPWFPPKLEARRLHDKETMSEDEYNHVWEGMCKPAVEGAIYFGEVSAAEKAGRFTRIPYDPMLKVHAIWDLGFADSMAIILAQRLASEIRIVGYIEDSHRDLPSYINQLKDMDLNWGNDWLPHDGFATRHQTGKSDEQVLKAHGRDVIMIPNVEVEAGIRAARLVFPRIYFNSEDDGVKRLIECLKRYRRNINQQTKEATTPRHDEFSHGADAYRYLCLVADQLTSAAIAKPKTARKNYGGGWMG